MDARRAPLGGNPLAGLGLLARSRYLLGIAAFVVLLASVTTFLYFEQARLVELHFPDRVDQVRVFGWIDIAVQALALLTQLFLTGRIVRRLGLGVLLMTVYRGADAVSAWVRTGIDAIATHPAMVMVAGAVLAVAWAACGGGLARRYGRKSGGA